MKTNTKPNTTLPFELGDERSFGGLTLVPLFPRDEPKLEYVGLDEAVARGLVVKEVDAEAIVGELLVENPLDELVLLYEGEELVGAKQNRIIQELTLVPAHSKARLPVRCVEAGRWSLRTPKFQPAPHAAYPSLRKESRTSQQAVWAEVASKAQRLEAPSPTGAQEAIYVKRRATIDEYAASLPRLHGQSGVLVGIGGKIVFLDYVSRSDVFAGLYSKLLRGYALEALETAGRAADRACRGAEVPGRPRDGVAPARRRLGRRLADGARRPRRRLDPSRPRGAGRGRGLSRRVGSGGEPNEPRPDDA